LPDNQRETRSPAGTRDGAGPYARAPLAGASVALVHDYLLVMRGAERTFSVIGSLWPDAPIHTLLYDESGTNGYFDERRVHASSLRHLGARQANFRRLLPFFPRAAQSLRLGGHDLVVSSSSAFAHGVRTDPGAVHICYCHTPFRYAWHDYARTVRRARWYVRPFLSHTLQRIREWDVEASTRVTHYIANSKLTHERIGDFWGREASIIHPPVDVDRFHTAEPEDYFLVVAELTGHKRVEVALEAAVRAGRPIKVVGSGPDLRRLERSYGSTVQFLGRVPERVLRDLYARSRALVVPNVEEFGLAAVEAQASGRPVLGATVGGTCETVIDGETGVLVTPENVGALAEAMSQVDFDSFSPQRIQAHAARFSVRCFKERFAAEVARLTGAPNVAGNGAARAERA
jgi:glycosyltransferase involved in cell wall biosynthesis